VCRYMILGTRTYRRVEVLNDGRHADDTRKERMLPSIGAPRPRIIRLAIYTKPRQEGRSSGMRYTDGGDTRFSGALVSTSGCLYPRF